jgi:predicted ATPase
MNKEIVVLIGGPSSGKTTLIEALKVKGHTCYPEISREVIKEAQEQGIEQLFLENPLLFSELLLEGRKKQFLSAQNETTSAMPIQPFLIKPAKTTFILQYLCFRLGRKST